MQIWIPQSRNSSLVNMFPAQTTPNSDSVFALGAPRVAGVSFVAARGLTAGTTSLHSSPAALGGASRQPKTHVSNETFAFYRWFCGWLWWNDLSKVGNSKVPLNFSTWPICTVSERPSWGQLHAPISKGTPTESMAVLDFSSTVRLWTAARFKVKYSL